MKITYSPVVSEGWNEALELLFQNVPELLRVHQIEEWLRKSLEGAFDLSGLMGAFQGRRLVGVIYYLVQPDCSALVWSPQCIAKTEKEVDSELIHVVNRQLDEQGVTLSQCLLELHDTEEFSLMCEHGYRYLADLIYMECVISDQILKSLSGTPNSSLNRIPYNEQLNHERFVEVLQKTYLDTLDCPQIQGLRSPHETLLSHKSSGIFHADRWTVYCDETGDCGLILLADHPEQDAWEVVYMGIVPEARGRGLGLRMVRDALQCTKQAGRNNMLVAVDKANVFAKKVYEKAGFEEIAARRVLMRNVEKLSG